MVQSRVFVAAVLALGVARFGGSVSAQSVGQANGTLVGSVLHADGTPAVGVGVGVLARSNPQCVQATNGVQIGQSASALAAFAVTDGMGGYRLENIPLGEYYLAVGTVRVPGGGGGGALGRCSPPANYSRYIAQAALYPGTTGLDAATPIMIAPGNTTAPNFRLPGGGGSGFKVSGRVVGTPVVNAGGRLIVRMGNDANSPSNGPCLVFRADVGPDGSFEIRNVPPCNYVATVMANYGDTGRGAFPGGGGNANVVVVDRDVVGLVLGNATGR